MSILRRICCINEAKVLLVGGATPLRTTPRSKLKQINSLCTSASAYASNPKPAQSSIKDKKSEWSVIYHLPIVRWASAFNRLKLYQGAISVAGIPATFMLEQAAILPAGSGVTFATVGLTGLVTLVLSSLVVQNLIGFVYIHTNGNRLKLAYVDYWGRRKDIIIDTDELVPDGAQEKPTRLNFYQLIGLKSNEKFKLKLLQRYGVVTNNDVFYSLFY